MAVCLGLVLAGLLVAIPFLDSQIARLPTLMLLLVVLCAARFGLRGGLSVAFVACAVQFSLLLHGAVFAAALPRFGLRASVFLLVGGLVGSVVSERRRFEMGVVAQNEMSRELISTTSFDGYFTKLNPAWTDVLGWSLVELMARPVAEFIHPDDVTSTEPEVVRQTVAGLPVVNFQNRYRCRDGSYRWLEWTSRSDERSRVRHAVARDITARKEAEDALASFQVALEAAVRERTVELEERTGELDESRRETLRRLALAAEFRDDETFEHTERVGKMAADLARRLGISPEQTALVRWAAPLHDVGKLALPDSVVLKPGRLTLAETREMRKHADNGARILGNSNSDVLQLAEQIARSHHEWWDGSGYPQGLAGEEIPLCARLVAVADVYDALTHARPYKEAWPVSAAIAEICRLRGRQFDATIVDAFLELNHEPNSLSTSSPALAIAELSHGPLVLINPDQTATDIDQTYTDSRQSESDADQLEADSDQARADREQNASDRDQAAADSRLFRDPGVRLTLALEASRVEHDAATVIRDAATVKRDAATVKRDAATVVRDAATAMRDVATGERDVASSERDAASRERDSTAAARSRTTAERFATADLRD